MGNCTSSKRIEASVATGVYRPALDFDINNIEEPWRTADQDQHEEEEDEDEENDHALKKVASSPVALDKLNRSLEGDQEAPPPTWEQVKKDLEFIKPTLQPTIPKPTAVMPPKPAASPVAPLPMKKIKRKSFSFHTLEELDTKRPSSNTKPEGDVTTGFRKIESMNNVNDFSSVKAGLRKTNSVKQGSDSRLQQPSGVESEGFKPVRQNIFLLKDRMERQKEGKEPGFLRRDPLSDYQELCPPGGADLVVVYTTSLGGVRRTYEDCYKVRSILELHRVVFDERDVSLHGEFLSELKELVGEEGSVPRLFVKGRYIGGVDEVVNLNETGKLRRIWNYVGVERGSGRQGCEGCGGARFVPCLDCGGSCKVVVLVEGKTQKQKCPECNENGLMHCPACL